MRLKLLLALILSLLSGLGFYSADKQVPDSSYMTPEEHRNGWVPPDSSDAEFIGAETPPFAITDAPAGFSSVGAVVKLWDFEKQINGGEHFPCLRQETGDCTSFGSAGSINTCQAVNIAVHGLAKEFHPIAPHWLYGVSRTASDIGNHKLGRSPGAVGYWPAEAAMHYGVLRADLDGVPEYSGKLADQWGYSGPPQEFYPEAEPFKLSSYAKVGSYQEARDAIVNGYPVTVASNQGFLCDRSGKLVPDIKDGKEFGRPSGAWGHQMYFKAVDDTVVCPDGSQGALWCQNSWGAGFNDPLGDAPPGGFWVSSKTANKMLGQGDSYAYSGFEGFPYRPLNFDVAMLGESSDVAEFPNPTPIIRPLCEKWGLKRWQMLAAAMAAALGAAGSGLRFAGEMRTYRSKQQAA